MNPKRLLSIDWDFMFPEGSQDKDLWQFFDWGHREAPFFIQHIWYTRAQSFLMNGMDLPGTSGEETTFWDRFKFSRGCRLYLADSHMEVYDNRVRKDVREVVNYDAHHDAGYKGTWEQWVDRARVSCEDWVCGYHLGRIPVTTVYPRWKSWAIDCEPTPLCPTERRMDTGDPDPVPFDRVFVCRSGAWVPSWLDEKFQGFLESFPGRKPPVMISMLERQWEPEVMKAQLQAYLLSLSSPCEEEGENEVIKQMNERTKMMLEKGLAMLG